MPSRKVFAVEITRAPSPAAAMSSAAASGGLGIPLADEQQEELLRQFAKLRGEERPQGRLTPAHPGVFSKLREKLAGR